MTSSMNKYQMISNYNHKEIKNLKKKYNKQTSNFKPYKNKYKQDKWIVLNKKYRKMNKIKL